MGRRKKNPKTTSDQLKRCDNKTPSNHATATSIVSTADKISKNSSSSRLLTVYSRLNLPLLELNENNLLTDSDDEETLEFEIRPRFVYSCNMCLVCMNVSEIPIICDKCKMLSYCSTQHKQQNRPHHEALCKVLCKDFNGIESFRFASDIQPDQYRSFRIQMIDVIEKKMNRRLDLWEREIILYPRVCRTCRKISDDLKSCPDCLIDFYCDDHREDHLKWCQDFQVFRQILWMQHKHGYVNPNFPDVPRKKCCKLSDNFDKLLLELFNNNVNYRRIDCYTYASMSLSATAPLTALFAMQKTCSDWCIKETFNIHVVGAEFQFECSSLRVWEKLFIHYLPKLKKLSLQFTGPELYLPQAPPELLGKVKLCRSCKIENREIRVTFNSKKLYHEIVDFGDKPDIICLFNPGLYRETGFDGTDTWPQTIRKFCDAKVPVLVTSYTEVEIPRDIQRIQSIGRVEILLEPQKNPFAAVKPDRNFVSDDIVPLMYKNYCLSVVRGL